MHVTHPNSLERILSQTTERRFFPALLGALHQEQAEGELILEQNDGTRRTFWEKGNLVYLQSDAAGEQFGNYLIRQGVLNRDALQDLLSAEDDTRFGDRVVQSGLVTIEDRNRLLQSLLEQILLNALEHPVVNVTWEPGPISEKLSADLRFRLDHRPLIWEAFQQIRDLTFLVDLLYSEPEWRWHTREEDLLMSLSDLSLTPEMAFALSFLGGEPLAYESFMSATQMEEDDAARLVVALWALGSLSLIEGQMPILPIEKSGKRQRGGASDFSTGQMPLVDPSAPPPPEIVPSVQHPAPTEPPNRIVPAAPAIPISWSTPAPTPPVNQAPAAQPLLRERATAFGPPPVKPLPLSPPPQPKRAHADFPELPKQPSTLHPPLSRPGQDSVWGLLPEQDPKSRAQSSPPRAVPISTPPPELVMGKPLLADPTPVEAKETPGSQELESPEDQARKHLKKAKILLIQGRTGEAIRSLEDSVRLDPESRSSFEAWLLLGKLRLSNPAWMNRAMEALQMATRVNPLLAEPWALMGEIYVKKEFRANAISCFKKALALDPNIVLPQDFDLGDIPIPSGTDAPPKDSPSLMGRIKGLFS